MIKKPNLSVLFDWIKGGPIPLHLLNPFFWLSRHLKELERLRLTERYYFSLKNDVRDVHTWFMTADETAHLVGKWLLHRDMAFTATVGGAKIEPTEVSGKDIQQFRDYLLERAVFPERFKGLSKAGPLNTVPDPDPEIERQVQKIMRDVQEIQKSSQIPQADLEHLARYIELLRGR